MEYINNEYLTSTSALTSEVISCVILLIVTQIVFIVLIYYWQRGRNSSNENKKPDKIKSYIMIVLFALVMALVFYKPIYNKISYINDIQINGENRTHYDVYLDGIKVDYNNVCISNYRVIFMDSEKKIILSSK